MFTDPLLPGIPLVESPVFPDIIDKMGLDDHEREIAIALNQNGFAVIDFPDEGINDRIERIKAALAPRLDGSVQAAGGSPASGRPRVQDAWRFDEDVKAIAANEYILDLLSRLYGRRAFPFQTLNFRVGTQQAPHTDAVHFSSIPQRFMCGVWLAMEDVGADAGPLVYVQGSHRWPLLDNVLIDRKGWGSELRSAQAPYQKVWDAMIAASGVQPQVFEARKGQALIWCANLLHGGSRQTDRQRTRWSQVTHYYFDECVYYTPAYSDEPLGRLALRNVTNVVDGERKPSRFQGADIADRPYLAKLKARLKRLVNARD
ncbi:hypothetical protein M2337_002759 [Sphingobium sp. B2D3A]|uniref:phytanoyl-CoA dioxygenase family protein n=1 Tax=unclassified Sphingobium TaxID=2611147 RepID=UPI0022254A75|nr:MULTISPECIES: phytanoyl-CoA dioxygenase family protein [unclassified Sphingobium]MCW2338526.1 hypothetical protein [Sphingobium sp. B2D3A]MCW2384984.1 hypothetical protein [Sphingobium sp. B2D3D]